LADNRDFQATTNEDFLAVDYSDIGVQFSSVLTLGFGNLKPAIRCPGGEFERQSVELPSATATSPSMVHSPGLITQG
jgi:hypothetical protein